MYVYSTRYVIQTGNNGDLYIFGENISTIDNTKKPEPILKKKYYSFYHESMAMGEF